MQNTLYGFQVVDGKMRESEIKLTDPEQVSRGESKIRKFL